MEKRSRIIIVVILLIVTIGVCIGAYLYRDYLLEQEILIKLQEEEAIKKTLEEKRIANIESVARESVLELFDEEIPKLNITDEKVEEVLRNIHDVVDANLKEELTQKVEIVEKSREVEKLINHLLVNGVLISKYSDDSLKEVQFKYDELAREYQGVFEESILKINKQKKNIEKAIASVKALYSDKVYVSESQFTSIYNAVGKMAVVIR